MSKLIIICGKPGSGKTTFADALAKELNLVCLHKDTIKESLYDSLNCKNLADSKRIGRASIVLLYYLVAEQLRAGADLIVESPFHIQEDYPMIEGWQNDLQATVYTVECSIGEQERKRRCSTRPRHKSHHDADRLIEEGVHEALEANFDSIPGKKKVLITDKPVEELVKEILVFLS